jgi:hypothetical protein
VLHGRAPAVVTALWRTTHSLSQIAFAAAMWLGAAVIVWGCAMLGALAADWARDARRPAEHADRWVAHEARRGVREIERYLRHIHR